MATETQQQDGIQTVLLGMDYFDSKDVVINDWDVLDNPAVTAPWVILFTSDSFDSRQDVVTAQDNYNIPAWLIVELGARSWKTAYDEFQAVRQAIVDKFNEEGTTARTAGGLDGVDISRIYSLSDITYVYPANVDPDLQPDATPEFMGQLIGFEIVQF